MKKLVASSLTQLNFYDQITQAIFKKIIQNQPIDTNKIRTKFLSYADARTQVHINTNDPYTTLFSREELEQATQSFSLLHGIYLYRMENNTLIPVITHAMSGIDRPGETDKTLSDYETHLWADHHPQAPHRLQSISKSISSLVFGLALQKAKLTLFDLDRPLSDFIPDCHVDDLIRLTHEQKEKIKTNLRHISVKDILNMSSGLKTNNEQGHNLYATSTPPWALHLLGDLVAPHKYSYADGDSNIIGKVIECVMGQSSFEFAKQALFIPLGITNPVAKFWQDESKENSFFCCSGGFSLSPEDLSKIGQFVLNGGYFHNAEHTVDLRDWIHHITTTFIDFKDPSKIRSDAQLVRFEGYSQYWWNYKTTSVTHNGHPLSCLMAMGIGGQKLFIVPDLNLIFITNGGFYKANAITHPEETKMLYDQSRLLFEMLITPYCNTK